MGSERIQLKLFSHASIKVVGLTHDFGESRRQVWMVAAPLLADAFERALQRRVDYLRGLVSVRHRAGNSIAPAIMLSRLQALFSRAPGGPFTSSAILSMNSTMRS